MQATMVAVGNVITDGVAPAMAVLPLTVTDVNGMPPSRHVDRRHLRHALRRSDGTYLYIANSALDALQIGDNPTDQFNFTVTDSAADYDTTLTLNITGRTTRRITSAVAFGSMTEDAGPPGREWRLRDRRPHWWTASGPLSSFWARRQFRPLLPR